MIDGVTLNKTPLERYSTDCVVVLLFTVTLPSTGTSEPTEKDAEALFFTRSRGALTTVKRLSVFSRLKMASMEPVRILIKLSSPAAPTEILNLSDRILAAKRMPEPSDCEV